jgi:hypothetical protein
VFALMLCDKLSLADEVGLAYAHKRIVRRVKAAQQRKLP